MSRLFLNRGGWSMVEMIVIVSLVSLLSIILMDIFLVHGQLFNLESAGANLETRAVTANRFFSDFLGVANQVMASQTIGGQTLTTSSNVLVLKIPSIDASGKVISGKYDYAAFYLDPGDNTKLKFSIEADASSSRVSSTKLIADFVNQLQFSYDNSNYENVSSVLVAMTLSKSFLARTKSFSVATKFNLGNR